MTDENAEALRGLDGLSSSARRLLDYAAVQEDGARYAVLRRLARSPEPDMIADLREVVEAGILAARPGHPDTYDFTHEAVRAHVLAEAGEERVNRLRARSEAAGRRAPGPFRPLRNKDGQRRG